MGKWAGPWGSFHLCGQSGAHTGGNYSLQHLTYKFALEVVAIPDI